MKKCTMIIKLLDHTAPEQIIAKALRLQARAEAKGRPVLWAIGYDQDDEVWAEDCFIDWDEALCALALIGGDGANWAIGGEAAKHLLQMAVEYREEAGMAHAVLQGLRNGLARMAADEDEAGRHAHL